MAGGIADASWILLKFQEPAINAVQREGRSAVPVQNSRSAMSLISMTTAFPSSAVQAPKHALNSTAEGMVLWLAQVANAVRWRGLSVLHARDCRSLFRRSTSTMKDASFGLERPEAFAEHTIAVGCWVCKRFLVPTAAAGLSMDPNAVPVRDFKPRSRSGLMKNPNLDNMDNHKPRESRGKERRVSRGTNLRGRKRARIARHVSPSHHRWSNPNKRLKKRLRSIERRFAQCAQ